MWNFSLRHLPRFGSSRYELLLLLSVVERLVRDRVLHDRWSSDAGRSLLPLAVRDDHQYVSGVVNGISRRCSISTVKPQMNVTNAMLNKRP